MKLYVKDVNPKEIAHSFYTPMNETKLAKADLGIEADLDDHLVFFLGPPFAAACSECSSPWSPAK